jgi:hypothetical protein
MQPQDATITAERLCFTIPEFVAAARVCKSKVYEEIRAGRLRAQKCGRRTLITRGEAERFIRELPSVPAGSVKPGAAP